MFESDWLWDNAKINDVQGCIVQVNLWTWKFFPIAELVPTVHLCCEHIFISFIYNVGQYTMYRIEPMGQKQTQKH